MRAVAALALALAAAAAPAFVAPAFAADDPPTRVGRVALISGEVAIFSDPEHGWEKAYINSPLTSENSLWTETRARAEVRIGSTAVRLDETTQLDIRRLDDNELRAHVVRGSITVRIRDFDRGERYVVTTPNARFVLTAAGRYRVDADEERGEALLTVFSGGATVEAARRMPVDAGDAVRVQGDGGQFDFERAAASPFDDWSLARDERLERGNRQTVRYVSRHMTGYEDLDEHGTWATEADYGAIWYPSRVGVAYVPYRDGRWAYVRPWGWTWVDNAPWGYAPFHYGRWVYVGNRWGWCPGRYQPRPVWAPALVGWVGSPGFSIAISGGRAPAMGWYPLSPWDRYQPWYTNNVTYINNVNIIVNRPPRGRERDRDHNRDRGATVVLREDFVRQRPVQQGITRVSGEAVREAVRTAPFAPNPTAVLPSRLEVQRPPRVPSQVGVDALRAPVTGSTPRPAPRPLTVPPPATPGATAVPSARTPPPPAAPTYVAPLVPQQQQQQQAVPPARTTPSAQPAQLARPVVPQAQPQPPARPVVPQAQPQVAPRPAPLVPAVPQAAPAEAQRAKPAQVPRTPTREERERSEREEKLEKPEKPGRGGRER